MPIRIRKTFSLFPGVKVNVSKGGTSITVGKKGVHLNFSKRGVRQTVGLPGSGISESSYVFKNKEDTEEQEKEHSSEAANEKPRHRTRQSALEHTGSPWTFFLLALIAFFLIYFGANALGLLPPNLLTNFLQSLAHLAKQAGL